jgi:transcriptional regulator
MVRRFHRGTVPTRRERAWDLLQQRPEGWSDKELAEALGSDEAGVVEDLQHLQRSAKRTPFAVQMLPARCRDCSWEAKAEVARRRPARCPQCRGGSLDSPRFRVVPR